MKLTTGEKINGLITEHSLTAEKLAEEITKKYGIHISKGTMSDILNDVEKGYSYKYFVAIADYFNVSIDYLLGLSDAPTPDKDLQFICDSTGLSIKAVNQLKNNNINNDKMKILEKVIDLCVR